MYYLGRLVDVIVQVTAKTFCQVTLNNAVSVNLDTDIC